MESCARGGGGGSTFFGINEAEASQAKRAVSTSTAGPTLILDVDAALFITAPREERPREPMGRPESPMSMMERDVAQERRREDTALSISS